MKKNLLLSILFCSFSIFSFGQTHISDANFAKSIRINCPDCIDGNDNLIAAAKTLKKLDLFYSDIKSIEGILGFSQLRELICNNNKLTSLPILPNSLTYLYCNANQLTSLPQLPSNLVWLECGGNQLTNLPNLPNSLTYLGCYMNNLTSLPKLPSNLIALYCFNNPKLACIDGLLPVTLSDSFDITNTDIKCLPNKPIGIANNTLPICNTTNSNGCFFTTSIDETKTIESLKIYPNPSVDNFFVKTEISSSGELFLMNLLGQVLAYQVFNQNNVTNFDISNLPKGLYLLTLKTQNGKVSTKVVKE